MFSRLNAKITSRTFSKKSTLYLICDETFSHHGYSKFIEGTDNHFDLKIYTTDLLTGVTTIVNDPRTQDMVCIGATRQILQALYRNNGYENGIGYKKHY